MGIDGEPLDIRQRVSLGIANSLGGLMEGIGSDRKLQIRITILKDCSEINGFIAIDHSPSYGPFGFECCELHEAVLA